MKTIHVPISDDWVTVLDNHTGPAILTPGKAVELAQIRFGADSTVDEGHYLGRAPNEGEKGNFDGVTIQARVQRLYSGFKAEDAYMVVTA